MENILNDEITNSLKNNDNSDQQSSECNSQKNIDANVNKRQAQSQNDDEALKKVESKIQDIERKTKDNISKVELLLKSGLLNPQQGESLIKQIINNGYHRLQQCDLEIPEKSNSDRNLEKTFDKNQAIIEFEKENPEFFKDKGRLEVLNYIKSGCLEFDKDEMLQISKLVEIVENSAIERYLKKSELEAKMQKNNEEAKSRLNANAQNAKDSNSKQVAFTREQIGKMSGAEFTKNEKLIMEQLKQGLIR